MATVWKIKELERTISDGSVTIAHWRATLTSGDYSVDSNGTVGFSPDASADGFVAFDSLDEATVIGWVQASVDKDTMEAGLQAQIDALENPVSANGLPW
tara:strand:- start:551 stop:847 length:297 start_codon:yes stop_codon:yes gene_type:complete